MGSKCDNCHFKTTSYFNTYNFRKTFSYRMPRCILPRIEKQELPRRAAPVLQLPYKTKKPRLFSRDSLAFFSAIMKRWCPPFGFHSRSFTNRFVCNFLSSSAGFNLCSCFFPAHPCRFRRLWAFHSTACRRFLSAF